MKLINKSWGARFNEYTDKFVKKFNASIDFDKRLYYHDIITSKAHVTMLNLIGVINKNELNRIKNGLLEIEQDIKKNIFYWSISLEDIHMNIEYNLIKKIGIVGKKLHTGRSRNDQVATTIRLYLRDEIDIISKQLKELRLILIKKANNEYKTIMPGFTHLQIAQPITLGHHLLAWQEMLSRDHDRLLDCRKRINILPLGSAALAGTTYQINRYITADLLYFDRPSENSIDSVSDRDFAIEFTAFCSILLMHLSRISEEIIMWTSYQFNFINLPDKFCTGSSIMPQKKNPDVPELIRGKTGRIYGNLLSLLTIMKSQPLSYNKDNQEDKEPIFDSIDTVKNCILAFCKIIPGIKVNKKNMYKAALLGYSTATDIADYLVNKNVTFRDAHEIVGKLVYYAIKKKKKICELKIKELQNFSYKIKKDIFYIQKPEGSVSVRNHIGGTAPDQVRFAAIRAFKKIK
ncbi:Argininosuccinate lyase [Candidatus Johnevansia muelleri]|uniref:Argininosuccinate lyase n=1 Tax=Candidatus Johnevansia muelleri TaxID=1495769 RepID=A0A078KEE0_9GAMM|nr:Argininosuccinate lyase [Candidatus Evansia muelleri]